MDTLGFTEFLRRHAGLIQRIARAYGRGAADREDIVQEIAVQLWRARERYDERCQPTTWIYRIALNVAISFGRRERRHREGRESGAGQLIELAAAPEVEPNEELERLLGCIEGLGAFDKALVLLYLDGNDHATTAEVLGISASNVGTKLGRIKERLRLQMKERPHGAR